MLTDGAVSSHVAALPAISSYTLTLTFVQVDLSEAAVTLLCCL